MSNTKRLIIVEPLDLPEVGGGFIADEGVTERLTVRSLAGENLSETIERLLRAGVVRPGEPIFKITRAGNVKLKPIRVETTMPLPDGKVAVVDMTKYYLEQ